MTNFMKHVLISVSLLDTITQPSVRFCSQRGLQIGPIQRMGAAPGVIHTGRFFVLIPLEVVGKINGGYKFI